MWGEVYIPKQQLLKKKHFKTMNIRSCTAVSEPCTDCGVLVFLLLKRLIAFLMRGCCRFLSLARSLLFKMTFIWHGSGDRVAVPYLQGYRFEPGSYRDCLEVSLSPRMMLCHQCMNVCERVSNWAPRLNNVCANKVWVWMMPGFDYRWGI